MTTRNVETERLGITIIKKKNCRPLLSSRARRRSYLPFLRSQHHRFTSHPRPPDRRMTPKSIDRSINHQSFSSSATDPTQGPTTYLSGRRSSQRSPCRGPSSNESPLRPSIHRRRMKKKKNGNKFQTLKIFQSLKKPKPKNFRAASGGAQRQRRRRRGLGLRRRRQRRRRVSKFAKFFKVSKNFRRRRRRIRTRGRRSYFYVAPVRRKCGRMRGSSSSSSSSGGGGFASPFSSSSS